MISVLPIYRRVLISDGWYATQGGAHFDALTEFSVLPKSEAKFDFGVGPIDAEGSGKSKMLAGNTNETMRVQRGRRVDRTSVKVCRPVKSQTIMYTMCHVSVTRT